MTAHDAPVDDALVAPPAKRARLQDSSSAKHQDASPVCVAASTRHGVFAPSLRLGPNEALLRTLTQGGVLRFLSLADAAALVQTSRALRTDTQLLASCARLLPDFQRLFPDESSVVFRLPPRGAWVEQLPAETPAELPAQVLATASFLKQRVAKWCFQFEPARPNADDDLLCAVQPVLIPLPLFRDAAVTPANGTASPPLTPATAPSACMVSAKPKWTRSPIKAALNAFCPGGGDAFFDDKSAAESRFATHWDSIYVDRVTGRVSCRLCDAVHAALTHYKQQVETGLRQHELLLRCQEAAWASKPPAQRQQLADAFRAKCFPPDAYIRPECAAWPEQQLLRHICAHGKLPAWQIGDTRARGVASADALLRAVSFKYQHQCRSFYQPLKKRLHAKCHVVGRLPHASLQHLRHEPIKDDSEVQNQRVLTELVGGVDCTSGIFTGVQVTFRLTQ